MPKVLPLKMFNCHYCSEYFSSPQTLVSHCNQEHYHLITKEWLQCSLCDDLYPSTVSLAEHQRLDHRPFTPKKGKTICDYCQKACKDNTEFYLHARKFHLSEISNIWMPCDICNLIFPSPLVITCHKNAVHREIRKKRKRERIDCKFCGKSCYSTSKYYSHANQNHPEEVTREWVPCNSCLNYFPSPYVLNTHKAVSKCSERDVSNDFHCEYCPSVFSRQYMYFKHANKEHKESIENIWLSCLTCSALFPTDVSLKNHTVSAHTVRKERSLTDKVLCSFCPQTLYSMTMYYKHANKKHSHLVSLEWLPCSICSKYYPSAEILSSHQSNKHYLLRENNNFNCQYCPRGFRYNQQYYDHANKEHLNELSRDWHYCSICSIYRPSADSIKIHRNVMHKTKPAPTIRKPKACPFCSKILSESSKYIRHINREHLVHVKDTWFQCSECQRYFPTDTSLKTHRSNAHKIKSIIVKKKKKVKPSKKIGNAKQKSAKTNTAKTGTQNSSSLIRCNFCALIFHKPSESDLHANQAHISEISSIWQKCEKCSTYFPTESALNSHFRTSHTQIQTVETCQFCNGTFSSSIDYFKHVSNTHQLEVSDLWDSCDECELLLPSLKHLKAHKLEQHGAKRNLRSNKKPIQSNALCLHCNETFRSDDDMCEHANSLHKDQISLEWIKCSDCSNYFPSLSLLRSHHQKSHENINAAKTDDRTGDFIRDTLMRAESSDVQMEGTNIGSNEFHVCDPLESNNEDFVSDDLEDFDASDVLALTMNVKEEEEDDDVP